MLLNAKFLSNQNKIFWPVKRQHEVFSYINVIPQTLILICVSHAEIWLI